MLVFSEFLGLVRRLTDGSLIWRFIAAGLIAITSAILAGIAPLSIKAIADSSSVLNPSQDHPIGSAFQHCLAYLAMISASRLMAEIAPFLVGLAEQQLSRRLSQHYFDITLRAPLRFHHATRSDTLTYNLFQAMTGCQILVSSAIGSFLPALIEVAAVLVVISGLGHAPLMVAFAAISVAYLAIYAIGVRNLNGHSSSVTRSGTEVHGLLTESFASVEALKSLGAESAFSDRFRNAARGLLVSWGQLHRARLLLGLATSVTFCSFMALALTFAVDRVHRGSMTLGGLLLVLVYIVQIIRPIETIGNASRDISHALQFLRPLLTTLKQPMEPLHVESAATSSNILQEPRGSPQARIDASPKPPMLCFSNVHFSYEHDRPVLTGLDLCVPSGRTLGIVGASGSGKSSLVRLILRLYSPQSGRILLDSVPIDRFDLAALRGLAGVVLQDAVLLDDTVSANISLAKIGASDAEIRLAARLAQVHDRIESLPEGYNTRIGERGVMLSGGERQRIGIARAILRRPPLLLLDEATSMQDIHTESALIASLKQVATASTTVIIGHRLSTVQHADEIAVMQHGRIVELGSHPQLLRQEGAYASMWRAHIQSQP